MARYPRWRFFLLLAVIVVAGVYALPNLYPDAPAVQVTAAQAGQELNRDDIRRAHQALKDRGLEPDEGEFDNELWIVRLPDSESQLRAQGIVEEVLGRDYVVALNLVPDTPDWLRALGASPMNLGLDLQGGVHFLLQVDMDTAIEQRMEAWAGELRILLRDEGIRYRDVEYRDRELRASFDSSEDVTAARRLMERHMPEFSLSVREDEHQLRGRLTESAVEEIRDYAVDQNRTALANRVNELGVAEPVVQRQGPDRIVVQLPGVHDAAEARRVLGRTATLEFRMVDQDVDPARIRAGQPPPGVEIYPYRDDRRPPVALQRQNIVTGDQVTNARSGFDQHGVPEVNITLDGAGARSMQRVSSRNIGNPMAVLFIETRTEFETYEDEDGEIRERPVTSEERYVINVANIRDTLSSRFRITGLDSAAEASELALLLRAGGLAAPIFITEERTVGPSMGADNIEAGLNSLLLGIVLVLAFMIVRYKVFGIIADIALLANLVVIVGVMSLIPGATLTLPGIAGIVLTVGMAVDANVLIFERIRQELRKGAAPREAIDYGYGRAFQTILDANITTLIVAVILFAAGTGTVQGFAVTLFIGILASMFTAIIGTRSIVELLYGRANQRAPIHIPI